MINNQYAMSVEDLVEFKDMKKSPMYRDYVNTITGSPIMMAIISEHVKAIDCTKDMEALTSKTPQALNTIFRENITNMAVRVVADTIVLKEIIDVGIEDAKEDINSNFKIKYIMGIADVKYYERAKKIIEENADTESVLYKGYVAYLKRNKTHKTGGIDSFFDVPETENKETTQEKEPVKNKKTTLNLDANDIQIG